MAVGEIISLAAVSYPVCDAAFEACRYGLALLKTMSSIRKTEITV